MESNNTGVTNMDATNEVTEVPTEEVVEISNIIELLGDKAKLPEVIAKLNEVISRLNQPAPKVRDRGPESTRTMTEDDARRVVLGDLKDASHKVAATQLGLAYGQIYSARKGFTFKGVYKELRDSMKAAS